ncbi:Hcp family type VI secretion system effector [Mixta calida]|nr:type VI secretion system tube protein Hcp [Mixta calida]
MTEGKYRNTVYEAEKQRSQFNHRTVNFTETGRRTIKTYSHHQYINQEKKKSMESTFLKIEGITGESQDAAHQGWIDVTSYTWGVWRNGDAAGPGASRYRNLSVQCAIDKATAAVLLFASNSNRIKAMHLSLCKAGNGMIESCRITLENVTVTDVNLDDVAEAAYEFQADKVKFQYWEQAASGIKGAESRMGWDIKNSTSCF